MECQTAADVRAATKEVLRKRREVFFAPSKPEFPKPELPKPAARKVQTLRLSYGCWIIGQAPPPVIPLHLQNRITRIMEVVAHDTGVSIGEMVSERKTGAVVRARQIAMWLCKERTTHSYPEIGRRFMRDHTTALHAWRRIELKRQNDPDLAYQLERIAVAL